MTCETEVFISLRNLSITVIYIIINIVTLSFTVVCPLLYTQMYNTHILFEFVKNCSVNIEIHVYIHSEFLWGCVHQYSPTWILVTWCILLVQSNLFFVFVKKWVLYTDNYNNDPLFITYCNKIKMVAKTLLYLIGVKCWLCEGTTSIQHL